MSSIAKLFPVTDAEKESIIGEFGKTKEDVKEGLEILKEWLKKQPQIPEIKDDSLLEHILIRNKFRMEKTKLKIDSYFTCKHVYADYFADLDPSSEAMIKSSKVTFSAMMPKLTPDCKRVHVWKLLPTLEAHDMDYKSLVRYESIHTESQMIFDYCPSIISIFDAEGYKMAHVLKVDMTIQSKMFKIFFEAFSGRISVLHVVNISSATEVLFNILKPLFPEKLRNAIQFHSDFESLHKFVPKECLPEELGGTEKSIIQLSMETATTFRNEREYIMMRNKTSTNEKLRIGKPPIETDLFGVEGTFKKITID